MQRYLTIGVIAVLCLGTAFTGGIKNPESALRASNPRQDINLDPLEAYLSQLDGRISAMENATARRMCQMNSQINCERCNELQNSHLRIHYTFRVPFPSPPSVMVATSEVKRANDAVPFKGYTMKISRVTRGEIYGGVDFLDKSITGFHAIWVACL